MKVVWYNVSIPSRYLDNSIPIAGWQDSLQNIIMQHDDIELNIVFEGTMGMERKKIDGVNYIPLVPKMSVLERKILRLFNPQITEKKLLPLFIRAVEDIRPDIIHIFGTEWGLCEIARYTDINVVVHMMGSVAPYVNALYPPGYSRMDEILSAGINIVQQYRIIRGYHYYKKWLEIEKRNFEAAQYYMGRTAWDNAVTNLFHRKRLYFYCNEALRPSFTRVERKWEPPCNKKLQLLTVGCSTHWKGMDMTLKTAYILKSQNIDFVWKIAGKMPSSLKKTIERKEKIKFNDCNIEFLGYQNSDNIVSLFFSSDMYIHTAYIDNSPNTICEAQYIGMPVISTFVGGIPSLIKNGIDGLLVPANDPYMLANEIMELRGDIERQRMLSIHAFTKARERHNPDNIYNDLLSCYLSIAKNRGK